MSHFDYIEGQRLSLGDPPFSSIIQAAMRKAGGSNLSKLQEGWPEIWDELQTRYDAPGGLLPEEQHANNS